MALHCDADMVRTIVRARPVNHHENCEHIRIAGGSQEDTWKKTASAGVRPGLRSAARPEIDHHDRVLFDDADEV